MVVRYVLTTRLPNEHTHQHQGSTLVNQLQAIVVVVVLNAPDHVMGADVGHVHIHVLILDEKTGFCVITEASHAVECAASSCCRQDLQSSIQLKLLLYSVNVCKYSKRISDCINALNVVNVVDPFTFSDVKLTLVEAHCTMTSYM